MICDIRLAFFSANSIHLCCLAVFTFCLFQFRTMGHFIGGHMIYLATRRWMPRLHQLHSAHQWDCEAWPRLQEPIRERPITSSKTDTVHLKRYENGPLESSMPLVLLETPNKVDPSWSKSFAFLNVVLEGGTPTNSWTLCFNNIKLIGVLGLSFKVPEMLELLKLLLFGNHENHSITKCFFANYWNDITKKYPFSNACWGYNF